MDARARARDIRCVCLEGLCGRAPRRLQVQKRTICSRCRNYPVSRLIPYTDNIKTSPPYTRTNLSLLYCCTFELCLGTPCGHAGRILYIFFFFWLFHLNSLLSPSPFPLVCSIIQFIELRNRFNDRRIRIPLGYTRVFFGDGEGKGKENVCPLTPLLYIYI